jgi:hypothetical protein
VEDDTVVEFDVAVGGTTDEAGWIDAVVTTHGVKEQKSVRETSPLHFTHTAPFDIGWIVVLFVARYFTTATPHARCGIEVKAVLFTLKQRWDVDGIITALHPRIGFVTDKTLQWGRVSFHYRFRLTQR